jgi:2-polyprenyl-3-methyl-5-hydroxy-6-metoxy-1,4-benzoquinol methylase
MPDFGCRSTQPELMDADNISFAEFHHCLQELETINRLTLAYRPTLNWLKHWLVKSEPLRILDAGSGSGDMLQRIETLARRLGKHDTGTLSLTGVDLNQMSKQSAELAPATWIRHETANIFGFEADQSIDIIICSLFTHHLQDEQVVTYLRWVDARAEQGWFVNDLHRHQVPYYFIKFATRMFSRNRLIKHDASLSVARSFTATDWRRLLATAGIGERARVEWYFPFRLCVSCRKT